MMVPPRTPPACCTYHHDRTNPTLAVLQSFPLALVSCAEWGPCVSCALCPLMLDSWCPSNPSLQDLVTVQWQFGSEVVSLPRSPELRIRCFYYIHLQYTLYTFCNCTRHTCTSNHATVYACVRACTSTMHASIHNTNVRMQTNQEQL